MDWCKSVLSEGSLWPHSKSLPLSSDYAGSSSRMSLSSSSESYNDHMYFEGPATLIVVHNYTEGISLEAKRRLNK
jgi:hypothetical protein